MKKTIEFIKIDYTGNGKKDNLITIEIELKQNEKVEEFTASGNIWNSSKSDIYCGGQCLDTINEYLKNNTTFKKIYEFWKKYHLNGMHPECEHQKALGWNEQAKKQVIKYSYVLDDEITEKAKNAKNAALDALKNGKNFNPSDEQTKFYNMPYFLDIYEEKAPQHYKPYKSCIDKSSNTQTKEVKTLGWVTQEEHPDGILSKPCPICSYKYGASWVFHKIPQNDLNEIKKLFEVEGV